MCYYDVIYCESCLFTIKYPPILCDKITSGIICTSQCHTESKKITNGELWLYDILPAHEVWIDSSTCSCGDGFREFMSDMDELNSMSSPDSNSTDYNPWSSMGEGYWDNNCGSPQWMPT